MGSSETAPVLALVTRFGTAGQTRTLRGLDAGSGRQLWSWEAPDAKLIRILSYDDETVVVDNGPRDEQPRALAVPGATTALPEFPPGQLVGFRDEGGGVITASYLDGQRTWLPATNQMVQRAAALGKVLDDGQGGVVIEQDGDDLVPAI